MVVDDCRAGVEIIWCHNETVRLSSESLAHQSVCWSRQTFEMFAAPVLWFGLIFHNDDNRQSSWMYAGAETEGPRGRQTLSEGQIQFTALIWSVVAVQPGWTATRSRETRKPRLRCMETKLNTLRESMKAETRVILVIQSWSASFRNTFVALSEIFHRIYQMDRHESGAYVHVSPQEETFGDSLMLKNTWFSLF